MVAGCAALGGMLEGGAGRAWGNDANGGASKGCDIPSVAEGELAEPDRPTMPGE